MFSHYMSVKYLFVVLELFVKYVLLKGFLGQQLEIQNNKITLGKT